MTVAAVFGTSAAAIPAQPATGNQTPPAPGSARAGDEQRPAAAPPSSEALARELTEVLTPPEGDADPRAALPRLARFLDKYRGRDLDRLGYAPSLYLFFNGEYDTAVRGLEAYFARHARLPVPAHASLVGKVYLNAIQEEAARNVPDPSRVQGFALRALELSQPPEVVGYSVQDALVRCGTEADAAGVRLTLVRRLLADGGMTDATLDDAVRALYRTSQAAAVRPRDAVTAPVEFSTTTLAGRPLDLRALRGRVVLLHFWASWCPISAAEAQDLARTYERYHTRGLELVGFAVESSDDDSVRDAARRLGFSWPQVHDGGFDGPVAQRFGVEMLPFALLLDRDGRVCARGELARGAALAARLGDLFRDR